MKYRHCLLLIPVVWIISFILLSPILIFHGQKFLSEEYICLIPIDDSLSMTYSMLIIYAIPSICTIFIYIRVSLYLHYHRRANKQFLIRNNRRDVAVLRRIIILIILSFSYGFPTSIMLIYFGITHKIISSFYRLFILSVAACIFTQSLTIIYVAPHFRRNLFHFQRTD